jgi:hypothetical protein
VNYYLCYSRNCAAEESVPDEKKRVTISEYINDNDAPKYGAVT